MAAARDWLRARWQLRDVEPGLARQIRVLSVVTTGIGLVGFPFVAQYWLMGVPVMSVAVSLAMLGAAINLVTLHRSHDVRRAGVGVVVLLSALLLLSNSVSGGFYDPNFGWLYTLPIAAALLVDARAGWVATGAVLLLTLGFWLAPSLGLEVPDLIPADKHAAQSLANRMSAIFAIGVMLAAIDSQRRFNAGLLEHAHEQTREQMQRRVELQAQLAQADRMASMGRLSAGLAHEINNPLSYVMGNLELVGLNLAELEQLEGASAQRAELHELVSDALDGTQRIAELVKSLRDFATVREDEPEIIELDAALDWALKILAGQIRQRARLVQRRTPGIHVRGDHGRLAQVFVNMIKNACQAIPPGAAADNRIEIGSSCEGGEALITISDTGSGMDADTQARLFEPFYTTKAQGEGMGLGMAICHGIVTALAGSLSVVSEPGQGSTFTIRLPLQSAADAPAQDPADQALPPLRLVLIDDEPLILRALEGLLVGHEIRTYCDPRLALDSLERDSAEQVDAVLCDVMMPELNGMQVHERLAKRRPELLERVLFMTGGVLIPEVQRFLDEIQRPALEKPIEGVHLRRALAELVRETKPEPS